MVQIRMWQSKEEEEKQRQLEKLIDWELTKQLTWAVVFLTTILGLMALLASRLLEQWINFSKFPMTTINLTKAPFVIIFLLLLIFGVNLSFYRLAASLVNLRNYTERLTSKLYHQELIEKAILKWFYGWFVKKKDKKDFSLRTELVLPTIFFVDFLLVLALLSV